jgi:hypothetical protein
MIEYREDPDSRIVAITVDGAIGHEEFDDIARRFEALVGGTARCVCSRKSAASA